MVKAKPQKAKYAHNPGYGQLVKKMATIIETTFESFGITVIVMEIGLMKVFGCFSSQYLVN